MGRPLSKIRRKVHAIASTRWLLDPTLAASLCALVALLVHVAALWNDFTFDDFPAVQSHPVVASELPFIDALTQIWTTNFWGGVPGYEHVLTWRPLTTLSFWMNAQIGGVHPFGYHVVNLWLHALVSGLVVIWLYILTGDRLASLLAGALFAVLPVHVEAVAGVVNRAELLCALFVLLAMIGWMRFLDTGRPVGLVVAVTCFAMALFSKEHAATWPALAGVLHMHRVRTRVGVRLERRRLFRAYLVMFGVLGLYLIQRSQVLPSSLAGDIPVADNPLVGVDASGRLLGVLSTYFHYLRVTVAPLELTVDYSAHALRMPPPLLGHEVLLGGAALVGSVSMLVWSIRKQEYALAACLGAFAVLYSLLSHVVILNTIVLAERLMYLPTMPLCGGFGLVVSRLSSHQNTIRRQGVLYGSCVLVFLGFAVRSHVRVQDFRDQYRLFSSAVATFPESARARYNLGHAALGKGLLDVAEVQFKAARRIDASDGSSVAGLGELAFRRGRYAKAVRLLSESLRIQPMKRTLARLCPALVANGEAQKGVLVCEDALRAAPDDEIDQIYYTIALERSGRLEEARAAASRLRDQQSAHPLGQAAIQRLLEED